VRADIRLQARNLFSEKDYVKALPLYRELLNSFPKEPEYQFCTAACIVNLNGNLDEAISLLKPLPVLEYAPIASYYLGRALHLNYSFEDAIKAYSKYILKSKGGEPNAAIVERMIEMARNGLEYTRSGFAINVQSTESIRIDELQLATAINGSGKLMKKPVEFCSKTDIRNSYRPWMFLPSYTEINEYIYTPGYEPSKKNNKQLFRIRNINHESWGMPELLDKVINTIYDEEYPFFDARTSTLYFSSNGHSSMGGYDIFSSVYDWNTKTWSSPENLGFPINSPYDEFVYVTDGFGSTVSFVSTRASQPGQATIYRLKLIKDTTGVRYNSAEEIKKASMLLFVEEKMPKALPAEPIVQAPSAVKHEKSNYNRVLADALQLQLRSDSAARITRDLRIIASEINEDSIKKQMVADILKNDKLAKSLQREADIKFAEARNLRAEIIPEPVDSAVIFLKEVNGIKVYQYKQQGANENETDNIQNEDIPGNDTTPANINRENPIPAIQVKTDEFSIQKQSPYSDINPIPQGISQDTGLIYRVQLGVFSKVRPNDAFGGIYPVAYEKVNGNAMLKYYAGIFYSLSSVSKALESIRSVGFPDAFIVAYYNGKMISTEKAKEIEFAGFKL